MPARDSLRIAANSSTFDLRSIGGPPARPAGAPTIPSGNKFAAAEQVSDRGGATTDRRPHVSPVRDHLAAAAQRSRLEVDGREVHAVVTGDAGIGDAGFGSRRQFQARSANR